jgi:hypothetical protein
MPCSLLLDLAVQFPRFAREGEQASFDRHKWPLTVEPNTFYEELCDKMGKRTQNASLAYYFQHEKAMPRCLTTNAHIRDMLEQAKAHLSSRRRAPITVVLMIVDLAVSFFY